MIQATFFDHLVITCDPLIQQPSPARLRRLRRQILHPNLPVLAAPALNPLMQGNHRHQTWTWPRQLDTDMVKLLQPKASTAEEFGEQYRLLASGMNK